jgi:Aspartate/tyrosine/aromatic aminotransferase
MDLTDAFLSVAHVVVAPGGVFWYDSYIRLSYVTSMENIVEGLYRIEKFINKVK